MVKPFLVLFLLISFSAQANLFDFDSGPREGKVPALVEKLKNLDMKQGPGYDEAFNLGVKAIENAIEEEKLYCSGEATDSEGKTLPLTQKQVCMKKLKNHYLNATETIFELKKKYLGFIHEKQMGELEEVQKKLKADIEKNF